MQEICRHEKRKKADSEMIDRKVGGGAKLPPICTIVMALKFGDF